MDPTWTTTILVVPCVVVLTAGFFYLYGAIISLLSKTSVRNKVVVITDALSGLGKGKADIKHSRFEGWLKCSSFFCFWCKECAGVFHRGGSRLILCGKSWEKLEGLADELENASDPTVVSIISKKQERKNINKWCKAAILKLQIALASGRKPTQKATK